ncbi:MAG: hypothetical protein M5U34_26160 [Chloroflexi bacterium]|nr:hypothetical protein [Chloroflexota bacterium]
MAGDVPVLLINEPMFISSGRNSDLRYNAFYPRWAYDQYREMLGETAVAPKLALSRPVARHPPTSSRTPPSTSPRKAAAYLPKKSPKPCKQMLQLKIRE